ncbi:MAG TPA: ABC transporter ATP-binding protein [Candidatus Lustribacter sp.]
MALIEFVDVGVCYRRRGGGETVALDRTSLAIAPGEFVCIVGPSGCGKTTLLHCLDGLHAPTSGRILIDGREITAPGRDRAMVFQSASLMPWRTVVRNVTYGLELHGMPLHQAIPRAQAMIELVGLAGFEDRHPGELSGGMQQRVNLARALVIDPQVILLDEPFAALDAQTRELMQTELLRVWDATKKTAVFITHQISEAVYLADRVVVMSGRPGRVKAIVPVPIGRPRPASARRDPQMFAIEAEVAALIDGAHAEASAV